MNAPSDVSARLDRVETQLGELLAVTRGLADQQAAARRTRDELLADAMPVLTGLSDAAVQRFADLEARGVPDLGRAGLRVAERVAQGTSVEDVDALADSVVAILDTVRALTQPEVLALAQEAGHVIEEADEAAPAGVVGLVRASRDVNVQKGLGILVAVLRHVGRASRVLDKKAQAVHRDGPSAGPPTRRTAPPLQVGARPARPTPPQAAPPAAFAEVGDPRFDRQGFLVDPQGWTEALAEAIAHDLHLNPYTEAHRAVVAAARADWQDRGQSPNVRRLSAVTALEVQDLYALFPKAPGRTVARIAGIPKPAGCI